MSFILIYFLECIYSEFEQWCYWSVMAAVRLCEVKFKQYIALLSHG